MRHMKSTVTGTLQEKNGRFYMVLRIPDSTGKLHQKWVSTGLPVQGNQRRARRAARREAGRVAGGLRPPLPPSRLVRGRSR